MIAAAIAPTWMIAVYAVTPGASVCRFSRLSAIVRCPVEEIGRNSVMPSTTPRMTDCQYSIRSLPQAGAVVGVPNGAQRLHPVRLVGREQAHRQGRDPGVGVPLEPLGDPFRWTQ